MVIILSNEATATGENAISCDLDRPLFPPLFLKWTKRRKSSAIERQHLSTFWGWKRRRAVESKKKKWPLVFGLTLATQSVSGKWTAQREKKGKTRLKRDKKKQPESLTAVLDFVRKNRPAACCLCPLSFWPAFPQPLPISFFPTDLMFSERDRWVNQDFLNGAQVCHWNWRSSQSGWRRPAR